MRLTADRISFLRAITDVSHAVSGASRIAVSALAPDTTVSATSSDGGAVSSASSVTIRAPGSVAVPFAPLLTILRGSTCPAVELDVQATKDATRLIVRTESGRFELPIDAEPLPTPDAVPDAAPRVLLDGRAFHAAVSRVAFAAERRPNPANWATTGVHIEIDGPQLRLTATDTHCCATMTLAELSQGLLAFADDAPVVRPATAVLLPLRTVKAWASAVRGRDDFELIAWTGGAAVIAEGLSAWSRPIAGVFPPCRDLLAMPRTNAVTLSPSVLLAAAELALVAADQDERGVMLRVAAGMMTLSSGSAETGAARVDVSVEYAGSPLAVTLDGRRLCEYLSAVAGEASVAVSWEAARAVLPPLMSFAVGESVYLAHPIVERPDHATR